MKFRLGDNFDVGEYRELYDAALKWSRHFSSVYPDPEFRAHKILPYMQQA